MTQSITLPRKYRAFLSYSSKDQRWASWLHRRLESYVIPENYRGLPAADGTPLSARLRPIFRDRDELSGSAQLGEAIRAALQDSSCLIVLCSPHSARSEWVNREIEEFKALGGEKRIFALILNGEPNASTRRGGDPTEECFPPALRHPVDPVAGDIRKEADGPTRAFYKLVAGVTNLEFDALYRRHERASRLKWFTVGSVATVIIAVLGVLSVVALQQARQARESLSVRLLEDGLVQLRQGLVDEGLQLFVASLRANPANPYARDRLLFELTQRAWFYTTQSFELPSPQLVERIDTSPKFEPKFRVTLNLSTDSIRIEERVDAAQGEREVQIVRLAWRQQDRWIVTPDAVSEEELDLLSSEDETRRIGLGDGRMLVTKAIENRRGHFEIGVVTTAGALPFKDSVDDGQTLTPVGMAALSVDRRTIAVVGLSPPRRGPQGQTWGPRDPHVYVTIFDAGTLVEKMSFHFPIAADADIERIWWSGASLAVHTQQDNRSLARLDWFDLSGGYPRYLVKNKGVGMQAWTFYNGRLYGIRESSNDSGPKSLRLEVQESRTPRPASTDTRLQSKADVLLTNYERATSQSSLAQAFPASVPLPEPLRWRNIGTSAFVGYRPDPEALERVAPSTWHGRGKQLVAESAEGKVTITSRQGEPARVVPVRVAKGEGGRGIDGTAFSPDGQYLVVQGHSEAGGSHDFEIIGTDVGLQVFPIMGRLDSAEIVPLFNNVEGLGRVIGWSRDGRSVVISCGGAASACYEAMATDDLGLPGSEGVVFVPLRYCHGPIPGWALDVIEQLVGVSTGAVPPLDNAGLLERLRALARAHRDDEYGRWLTQLVGPL